MVCQHLISELIKLSLKPLDEIIKVFGLMIFDQEVEIIRARRLGENLLSPDSDSERHMCVLKCILDAGDVAECILVLNANMPRIGINRFDHGFKAMLGDGVLNDGQSFFLHGAHNHSPVASIYDVNIQYDILLSSGFSR